MPEIDHSLPQDLAEAHDPIAADSPERHLDLALDIQALQILDSSDDCIKVLDLDGRILFMSRGGQVLLGIQDITPFLNTSWVEFWQAADRQAAIDAIAQARTGDVCTFQGYCPTPSGEPKWWDIKISPIRGTKEQVERLLCISRDITDRRQIEDERKQAEAKLRESEERYRAIINQAVTGVACTDLDGNLTLGNQKYYDITGYSANELSQRRMQDITHPEDLPRNIELFERMRTEGTPFEIEKRYIRKDGSIVWVNNSVSVIRDRDGKPQSAVAIVLDVTERKRREAHATFLTEIGDDLSRLSTANEIMQTVGAKIGAYLQITTCNFTDVDEVHDRVTVHHGWSSPEVTSTVGTFRTSQYLSQEFERASRTGETVVICNTQNDPRTDAAAYAALNMHSFVTVPFHRNGQWTHYIAICHSQPRDWREDEIQLIEEISNRIFPRLQRVRTETALRESEAKYRLLFDSIDEGFCIIEVLFDQTGNAFDYRFLEANAAFEKQTGLTDAIGKTMREFAPQMETHWFEIYGRIALTGVPERFENTAQELGRFYDVYAFRMGEPQERKVAVLFNDISDRKRVEDDRKRAEQNLRESEEWARLAIQVARLGGWRLHLATSLVEMDERMREIWGEPEDRVMVPLPQVIERIHSDDRERVANAVNAAIDPQSAGTYEIEYRIMWNDGTERWVLAKGQAQFAGTGASRQTVDFFGTLLDITDRKQAEVEREQLLKREQAAREQAEQANRIKDEFLAVLSHELRSPLNPILGWSKLLQSGRLDPAKTAQALATIARNAKLQSELIEDLLDVSRILRGKLSLNAAPVNLALKIRGAMETVQLAAEAKSIHIEANLAEDVGQVLGDSTRLQQVIWNLLSNAVKFTPEGGRVEVRLEAVGGTGVRDGGDREVKGDGGDGEDNLSSLSASSALPAPSSSYAQITVSDTGQGIAPEFLPYVFDYFRQADGATTRKFGGLGLGLAIVRHLVELHGGTVRADSLGEGQGATFTIRLPLMPNPLLANPEHRSPQPSLDLNGIKILVVDDETDTRELVAFVLEQQGAQVTVATSAYEVLLVLPQAKPDVLLSDIGMPEMDGYMLIQHIRALAPEQGGQIPAIALTAYAGDIDQQRVIAAGFQKHISKPIEPEALVQAIAGLLNLIK